MFSMHSAHSTCSSQLGFSTENKNKKSLMEQLALFSTVTNLKIGAYHLNRKQSQRKEIQNVSFV